MQHKNFFMVPNRIFDLELKPRDFTVYVEMPKLTSELLRVFIRRIEVYEKFEKYSRTAGNPIRIHYAFRLPEQEGIPAIEVLAQSTAKTA